MAKIGELLDIMARLRDPEDGCPWDLEQTFETIAPYTIEEAYEVDHAIRLRDTGGLCDELGDLLLQIVFHARIAEEAELFDFSDVVDAICAKLVRRHPHVFPEAAEDGEAAPRTAAEQTRLWEARKARERADRQGEKGSGLDPFDGIPHALPALTRSSKLRKRADESGYPAEVLGGEDWKPLRTMIHQMLESSVNDDPAAALGELLALCVAIAKERGVDPEAALRGFNQAFEGRVRAGDRSGISS